MHRELSDDLLVKAARQGDVDSFAELYRRHVPLAFGIAYCELSDRGFAEDAAQESFAEVCRHLEKLRDGRKFPQWLAAICRRVAGRMRKSKRRQVVPAEHALEHEELEAPVSDTDSYDELIRDAVEALPHPAREAVVLRYFSELTHEEIANTLNITPAAVHGRLTRAREQLRQYLTRKGLGMNVL